MSEYKEENYLEDTLKISLKNMIEHKVQKEIDEEVEKFRERLESRKDDYIAEIMKGIRIYHEYNDIEHCVNYKIIFENVVTVKKEEE